MEGQGVQEHLSKIKSGWGAVQVNQSQIKELVQKMERKVFVWKSLIEESQTTEEISTYM